MRSAVKTNQLWNEKEHSLTELVRMDQTETELEALFDSKLDDVHHLHTAVNLRKAR